MFEKISISMFACIFAFVLGFGIFMYGCGTTSTTIPVGCENSLIYKTVPDVKVASTILQLAGLEALKKDVWKAAEAKGILNKMLEFLSTDGLTYADFIQYATANVKWLHDNVTQEVVIIVNYADSLNQKVPINSCDLDLLKSLIKKELAVVAMYAG